MAVRPNVLSICTGAGGLDLGLRLARPDARVVCYVEREAFPLAVLATTIQAGLKDGRVYFHLHRMISETGHECSEKCQRLNPVFVEWLMGWPIGWTSLPLGLIDSRLLEMELCHWWRLMRSSLSRLGHLGDDHDD